MEHLPLPRDPINGHPTIKLASAQFHNPGPFLEYPERHGSVLLGQHPHVPTQADALRGQFAASVSSYEVLDYYQGWLFFSLIKEFLGEDCDMRNYLSCTFDDEGRLTSAALSTRSLHHDLAKLRANGPLAAICPGDECHLRLGKCLDLAFETFDIIEARFPGFSKVFPEEIICLASVAETLDSAVQTSLDHGPARDMVPDAQYYPAGAKRLWFSKVAPLLDPMGTETRTAMINAGWCPGDIGKIRESFTKIDAFYYLSRFKADPAVADLHKDCENYGCRLRIPAEPRHEAPGCECPGMMTFDEQHLIDIYQKGDIPCFSIGRLEDGNLGIALISCSIDDESQKNPDNHYVAVSHVWSEGMGNPQANALPFCQLAKAMHWAMLTYQIVEEKAEEDEKAGRGIHIQTKAKVRQVNLWVDTMCCPATPGYGKNLCLSRMREIYAKAYAVLVRSSVLEATRIGDIFQDTSKGVMDVATRIYTSPWMRRMWTLQEGVLAGASRARGAGDRLCFAFRDSLLSLESVVSLLKQAPEREASLAFRFISEFRDLSTHMWQLPDEDQASGGPMAKTNVFMKMLTNALKYRSLTVASDEAICLATLLDLRINSTRGKVEPLIGDGQTPEDGICELWRRVEVIQGVSGLPSDIIFSDVPRAQVGGFRWAPRTLVQYAKYGELQASHSSPYPSKIVRGGLRVQFPGATLTCLGDPETVGRMLPGGGKEPGEKKTDSPIFDGESEDETALPRIIMVKMPKDGKQWYGVRAQNSAARTDQGVPQESGVSEESTSTDLHGDLVRFIRDGNCALIFRPGEMITGAGLLVSTPRPPPPSNELGSALEMVSLNRAPLQVRSEFPVKITPMAGSSCVIAENAARCIDELCQGIVAGARQRGGEFTVSDVWDDEEVVCRLLDETAQGLLESSAELKEALYFDVLLRETSATDENALKKFLRYIRHMAYFGGGMIGEICPEDQAWCVD